MLTKPTLFELHNAGVRRGGQWPVRGVNLSMERGEIVTLIGPNGSGKSTTAKLALGLIKPDEGSAMLRTPIQIGYVPQKIALDWTLPLPVSRFMRLTGSVSDHDLRNALAMVNASHLLSAAMQHLSGGETQRVMLARAIARKPDLLVLDEPVQGVDVNGEAAMYDLIARTRDSLGCGILLISHDLHVVMAATDRVLCLNGHVCCEGTPSTVMSSKAYQSLFGARSLAAGLAVYNHHHDHQHLPDGRVRHADGSITHHCHPGDGHHHDDHADGAHNA